MSQRATFACTALLQTGKKGILKPDDEGYYPVVLGAYDVCNSAGALYPLQPALDVFKSSGPLMRRISRGACRGEYGHPKRLPGMTDREFLHRVMQIYEERVCFHIRDVTLDSGTVKDENGRPVTVVCASIKPCGPLGHLLEASLKNPNENVAFSVRALTDDFMERGQLIKHTRSIVTWDYVNEPGLAQATKYNSPALESAEEVLFTRQQVESLVERQSVGASMESFYSPSDIVRDMGWNEPKRQLPGSMNW
ncbi:MAG: hypothetical protein CL678_15865 [Bdellovibrionaceae bacterium]|nr:hypothetical protein [Pseudobdellovibrionaceae bacterium]